MQCKTLNFGRKKEGRRWSKDSKRNPAEKIYKKAIGGKDKVREGKKEEGVIMRTKDQLYQGEKANLPFETKGLRAKGRAPSAKGNHEEKKEPGGD